MPTNMIFLVFSLCILCSGASIATVQSYLASASAALSGVAFNTAIATGADVFLNVPIVIQQYDYTCGAATTTAILQAYGYNVTEDEMMVELHSNEEVGTLISEIVAACIRRGLIANRYEMLTIEQLQEVVARNGIVIVAYQAYRYDSLPWPVRWQDGHYSAVLGFDWSNVFLMDPSQDEGMYGSIPVYEFLQRWHDIDGTDAHGTPVIRMGIVIERGSANIPIQRVPIPSNINYTW